MKLNYIIALSVTVAIGGLGTAYSHLEKRFDDKLQKEISAVHD